MWAAMPTEGVSVHGRSNWRLLILGVLIASLLATLAARLFYLQVISGSTYRAQAHGNSVREVVNPAVRGLILDQLGRPLVSNQTSMGVTVDRHALRLQKDHGAAVISRLAGVLGVTPASITDKLAPCGTPGAKRPPICWNGPTYQPVPVATKVPVQTAITIMEMRSEFPGITAQMDASRTYPSPFGANAAHLLGYLGPVTQSQLNTQGTSLDPNRLRSTDLIGRTGLEKQYDTALRGKPAVTTLSVDTAGHVLSTLDQQPATPGNYVVTSIDAKLQAVVEKQLAAAIDRAHTQGFPGVAGAAVVVDVRTGRILSMASYPTYDPSIWVGGVSKTQYDQLMKSNALNFNAMQGLYAPGSTFKAISTAAAGTQGFNLYGTYPCPNQLKIGSQTFRNFESSGFGPISLKRALEVSCNTVFYGISEKMWNAAGGVKANANSPDPIAKTAKMFGLGSPTGIDLPGESTGRVSSRAFKEANWQAHKNAWCANALSGYPTLRKTNPTLADYYTSLDKENCANGFLWRPGDALNQAIGQGDTAVTPLQMAMVYAAVANGGTVYEPTVAKAIVDPTGKVVQEITPKVKSHVNVPKSVFTFLHNALPGVAENGSAKGDFVGFPLSKIPIAAKTGSAQVSGNKVSTSWFATYAPANNPKYAVLMMVSQGGTGAGTSGPSVRKIYEALFGVNGTSVDPTKSVLFGDAPQTQLPKIRSDGTPVVPKGAGSGVGGGG